VRARRRAAANSIDDRVGLDFNQPLGINETETCMMFTEHPVAMAPDGVLDLSRNVPRWNEVR
jgi:hypothetical protein